ncbi:MAG: hypothetical protein F4Y41_17345 [Gammaproteobacteria bacterium]|nr:hypothetical protein [Gammaproteobacteria bacterium]
MSVEERTRAVPLLIEFPVREQLGDMEKREFVNPLSLVNLPPEVGPEVLDVPDGSVDELLVRLADRGTDHDWAATSLVWLHEQGKLDGPQSQRLASLLWEGMGASGVPTVPGFYSFACMRLPRPPGIDPEPRVKEHLRSEIGAKMGSSGLADVLDELRQSAGEVSWSAADAFELLAQFRAWWDEHKPRLHWDLPMPFGSPAELTRRTIWRMVSALAAVLAKGTVVEDRGSKDALRDFISDLTVHGIPALRLELALTKGGDGRKQLIDRIAAGMSDSVHDNVVDALLAARFLATAATDEESRRDFEQVSTKLAEGVEWRHRPALVDRLRVAAGLVREHRWFVAPVTEASLLRGLACIQGEGSERVSGNDGDGVILTRASAASLAFELFRHYQKLGVKEPETVRRWQEICSDPNEFAEVRNAWATVSA